MRFPWLVIVFLLFSFSCFAQSGIVSGVVTNAESKNPLPRASVFLSNSQIGTATNEEGKFTLSGIRPGQYTLTVTIIGYEDYRKTILIGTEPIHIEIALAPKPLMLREVVISSEADWRKNYAAFRKEFIGTDENAKECVVLNPHILNLVYNRTKQTLEASSDEFLVVENKALGYRVKFLLKDFVCDHISNITSYGGERLFEDLPGNEAQKKKWHQKREEVYYGSAMHFYRSLYMNKLEEEGFITYHLIRNLNPERAPDDVIRKKQRFFYDRRMADSLKYYNDMATWSKYIYPRNALSSVPYHPLEIYSGTGQQGLFTIHFPNYLYVAYTKRRDEVYNKDLYRPLDMPNYEVSIVTLLAPSAMFDMNGIIVSDPPLIEGAWAKSRLSDLLPVDYVPDHGTSLVVH